MQEAKNARREFWFLFLRYLPNKHLCLRAVDEDDGSRKYAHVFNIALCVAEIIFLWLILYYALGQLVVIL